MENETLSRLSRPCAAFADGRMLAAGPLVEVALAVKNADAADGYILTFDDATGEVVDLDLRGAKAEIIARLASAPPAASGRARSGATEQEGAEEGARGRGRPRLGVVAREITLLPRHWDWLGAQPGGASAALRRLVDAARREGGAESRLRMAREAAYRFLAAVSGNLPGYEEALRALFAGDDARFESQMAEWPKDVRAYALRLARGAE
ncbi:DUF2239 family protein [Methylosinus sp. H3A]|uniref:DUF2239 family protein n=1 Tax=Methylosinus sp. H3A TaxID=2785786 RepID=UPI0018C1E971|nr:DUF2239 family protein [Methylosinus sp. H3A]MBG0809748.1 DUF2239 family protein [Methylosinus sp. H3A]